MDIRVGQGVDIHPLVTGRPLVLGGVVVPFDKGLDGHSDADVLVHALIDALLGAAGRGDIGSLFPDTSAEWKDADSMDLLRQVWRDLSQDGWLLQNLDATVLAEQPKLQPHVSQIKSNLAKALGISESCCGIKATRGEKMGFVGRQEGIAAMCVVLLTRNN